MTQVPFQLRYKLNRRQRVVPHLVIWAPYAPVLLIMLGGTIYLSGYVSLCFIPLVVVMLWLLRGFIIGLVNVIVWREVEMDIIVEQNYFSFLAGGERWCTSLDGMMRIGKICEDIWTMTHFNGSILNIPVDAITDEQIAHLVAGMERGIDYLRSLAQRTEPNSKEPKTP